MLAILRAQLCLSMGGFVSGPSGMPVFCFSLDILSSCCGIFNFASIGKSGEGRPRFLSLFRVEFKGALMAIKPKIYKLKISLSDVGRDYYDTLFLGLPSILERNACPIRCPLSPCVH